MDLSKRMLLILLIAASLMLISACGLLETNNTNDTPEPGPDPEIVPTEVVAEPQPTFTPPEPTPELELPTPTPEPDEEEEEIPETGPELAIAGEDIYLDACAGCHMNDGSGVQAVYPALNNNPFVAAEDPGPVTQVIITGRGGMPTFHTILDPEELAAVVSYIRTAWNNNADFVTVEEVREIWDQTPYALEDDEEEEED
jgi:mono/diheme cytochrome c family protein